MNEIEAALRRGAPGPEDGPPPLDLPALADEARLLDVGYVRHDSPLGTLLLAATPRGLVRISYLNDADADAERVLAELAERVSPRVLHAPRTLDEPRRELEEFFAGRRRRFELALDLRLARAGFQRRVLRATGRIPFGAHLSYKQVASAAGSPRAFRAAGTALGANPLPIVIPCHRVLHAGGGLGGYTGGLERKRILLGLEGFAT